MEENKYTVERSQAWREALRKSMPAKERTAMKRVVMPEVEPNVRNKSNVEVNIGLTEEEAWNESKRCLDCPNPTCVTGCPVEVNIPKFIKYIENRDFLGAAKAIKETSALPAVCGRVCPQEKQCESKCMYPTKLKLPAVAIGYLERFAADYERNNGKKEEINITKNGKKVAVAGSGPAGLTFAGDMAKMGYDVTVFEALHEIGGVLKYGIPEFRLPNSIVEHEIENLRSLGVHFVTDTVVGRTITIDDLKEQGFQAMFVGSGAGLPRFMNIPGENLVGIFSCNEYLTRLNLMNAAKEEYDTPILKGKNVVVIGGGNTAMDAVRSAKRQGAEKAMIIYRRSMSEMPARKEEIAHAMAEGVEFLELTNPIQYNADETGRVKEVVVQKMELGEPDASGRRSAKPIAGSEYTIPTDLAIVSVGVSPNPIIPNNVEGLTISPKGTIVVDENAMQSSNPFIFAGGDIVRGGATVILAMGDGKRAAKAMNEYLNK